jgi:prefoldin subunit 5
MIEEKVDQLEKRIDGVEHSLTGLTKAVRDLQKTLQFKYAIFLSFLIMSAVLLVVL